MTKLKSLALALGFVLGSAIAGSAQTVVNPTHAVFEASTNHNTIHTDGVPIVDHYELEVVSNVGGALVLTIGIGKPTPVGTTITHILGGAFAPIARDVVHRARATAVGPGGVGRSAESNPFVLPSPTPAPGAPGTPALVAQ